ncbi:MAG: ubiquinol-cytochrome C chaperone family protein [Sphingomicrobium sp.]
MAMMRPKRPDAAALYAALVAEARAPGWFLKGGVADDQDGRFAVLSSVVALGILRLESGGEDAVRGSVALTEAFIADMDSQMRQEGFGDPSLGKQVRHMVGALANRVDRWRQTLADDAGWDECVAATIHRGAATDESARTFAAESMRRLHETLNGADDSAVLQGRWR